MMQYHLLLSVFLIFLSCSKDVVENKININEESTNNALQYSVYINPTNGGTIEISSQERIINETDLERVPITSITSRGGGNADGGFLEAKLADEFDRDTELNVSATANEGFKFIAWTIHTCNKCYWSSITSYRYDPLIQLNINSDIFLTATFEKIK